jgi:hypothetical protein
MKRAPERIWDITIGVHRFTVRARYFGTACRHAISSAIKAGYLKRQPASDRDTGGFVGISGEVRSA